MDDNHRIPTAADRELWARLDKDFGRVSIDVELSEVVAALITVLLLATLYLIVR